MSDGMPQHRGMVAVDVEGSGDPARTDLLKQRVRRGLYEVVETALREAGLAASDHERYDRGDGLLLLFQPYVSKVRLLDPLVVRLEAALRHHNEAASEAARIRLRVAAHAGEVLYDPHGSTGEAIYLLFRLLDSEELRDELAGTPKDLAVMVSDALHGAVVKHGFGAIRPDEYREVRVRHKELDTLAWLWSPPPPPGRQAQARAGKRRRAREAPADPGGGHTVHVGGMVGDLVMGDKVMGDKHVGGAAGPRAGTEVSA